MNHGIYGRPVSRHLSDVIVSVLFIIGTICRGGCHCWDEIYCDYSAYYSKGILLPYYRLYESKIFSNYLLYMIILFICLLNYTKRWTRIYSSFSYDLIFVSLLFLVLFAFKVRVCAFAWAQIGEKINNRLPTNWVFFSFLFFVIYL